MNANKNVLIGMRDMVVTIPLTNLYPNAHSSSLEITIRRRERLETNDL